MQIIVNTGKANIASADLLALSRTIRNLREEVEDVRRQLRQHTQLDSCRAELRKQEEALSQQGWSICLRLCVRYPMPTAGQSVKMWIGWRRKVLITRLPV